MLKNIEQKPGLENIFLRISSYWLTNMFKTFQSRGLGILSSWIMSTSYGKFQLTKLLYAILDDYSDVSGESSDGIE